MQAKLTTHIKNKKSSPKCIQPVSFFCVHYVLHHRGNKGSTSQLLPGSLSWAIHAAALMWAALLKKPSIPSTFLNPHSSMKPKPGSNTSQLPPPSPYFPLSLHRHTSERPYDAHRPRSDHTPVWTLQTLSSHLLSCPRAAVYLVTAHISRSPFRQVKVTWKQRCFQMRSLKVGQLVVPLHVHLSVSYSFSFFHLEPR